MRLYSKNRWLGHT